MRWEVCVFYTFMQSHTHSHSCLQPDSLTPTGHGGVNVPSLCRLSSSVMQVCVCVCLRETIFLQASRGKSSSLQESSGTF